MPCLDYLYSYIAYIIEDIMETKFSYRLQIINATQQVQTKRTCYLVHFICGSGWSRIS